MEQIPNRFNFKIFADSNRAKFTKLNQVIELKKGYSNLTIKTAET